MEHFAPYVLSVSKQVFDLLVLVVDDGRSARCIVQQKHIIVSCVDVTTSYIRLSCPS